MACYAVLRGFDPLQPPAVSRSWMHRRKHEKQYAVVSGSSRTEQEDGVDDQGASSSVRESQLRPRAWRQDRFCSLATFYAILDHARNNIQDIEHLN